MSMSPKKDSLFDQSGFCVLDKFYLSARWAGDSYTFACKFVDLLMESIKNAKTEQYETFVNDEKKDSNVTEDVL